MEQEIWKDIPGYEGYQASNFGRIKYTKITYLKPKVKQDGRNELTLYKNGKCKKSRTVSRLVSSAFHGLDLDDPKQIVMHLDDNPSNNHKDNLRVGTHQENMQDKINKGRQAKGNTCGMSKLNSEQVKEIRELGKTKSKREIARQFNMSDSTIGKIINNKLWIHELC